MGFVAGNIIESSSGTTPTHAVGDLLIVLALRFESTTIPSLPAGWTSIHTNTPSGRGIRIGWKIATATNDPTGTWTNAARLYAVAVRDFPSAAAAATLISDTETAQTPGLTLTQPGSWVLTLGQSSDTTTPAVPSGTVSRWTSTWARWSDTNGPVTSWDARTTATQWLAASIELIPTETLVGGSYQPSWDVLELTVGGSYAPSWDIEAFVGGWYAPSWSVEAITGWRALIASPAYLEHVNSSAPMEASCRVIVVDQDHQPVTVLDQWGDPLGPVPVTSGEVTMTGESDQMWSCRLTIDDQRWVPRTANDPLDPRSPYLLAIFWREKLAAGMWAEVPLGVYRTGEPKITDNGTVSISVDGKDVLSVAKRGGYGGAVVPVGGLTVDAALRRLFATVAPLVPFAADASTVTLPAVYELGRRKPSEDWTEVGGLDEQAVRATREGNLRARRQPDPQTVKMRLIEGPGCLMTELGRDLSDTIYNRVTVTGTNPDLTAPVFGFAEDDDETSPTYVGRFGPYELSIDSDAVTTNAAADSLAAMHLGKYKRPTETLTARVRPRPDLEYRDLVEIVREGAGVAGEYRVSSTRLPLPIRGKTPALMEVTFMARQVAI